MKKNKTQRLIAAIQFLTIIPMGKPAIYDPKGMIPFFPIVGLIIGTLVSIFDYVALTLWPVSVVAVLDVVFLAVITAALHLDGLGDTADGLLGHHSKEKALSIMKDSRIGVMGLVAIVCGLAIKWGGILNLEGNRALLIALIPAYARSGMVFGIRFLAYGRPDGGTGQDCFQDPLTPYAFWGLIIPVAFSCFLGLRGIWLIICFIFITSTILFYYNKRMGCITGDMLGAMSEVTESMLFLLVSMGSHLC
jgi:adenosylcobinamide-GDP ribazoletransferase